MSHLLGSLKGKEKSKKKRTYGKINNNNKQRRNLTKKCEKKTRKQLKYKEKKSKDDFNNKIENIEREKT